MATSVTGATVSAPCTASPPDGDGGAGGQAGGPPPTARSHSPPPPPPPPPLPSLAAPPGITFGPITPGPVLDQLKALNAALFPVNYQVRV